MEWNSRTFKYSKSGLKDVYIRKKHQWRNTAGVSMPASTPVAFMSTPSSKLVQISIASSSCVTSRSALIIPSGCCLIFPLAERTPRYGRAVALAVLWLSLRRLRLCRVLHFPLMADHCLTGQGPLACHVSIWGLVFCSAVLTFLSWHRPTGPLLYLLLHPLPSKSLPALWSSHGQKVAAGTLLSAADVSCRQHRHTHKLKDLTLINRIWLVFTWVGFKYADKIRCTVTFWHFRGF